jgi:hypothetical protein
MAAVSVGLLEVLGRMKWSVVEKMKMKPGNRICERADVKNSADANPSPEHTKWTWKDGSSFLAAFLIWERCWYFSSSRIVLWKSGDDMRRHRKENILSKAWLRVGR